MIRPKRRCLKFEVSIDAGGGGLLHTGKTRVWTMTFLHGSSHVWIGVKIWTKILLCEKVTTVLLDAQLVEEDLEEWVLEEKRESATSQLHQNQPLARTSTDFSSQSRCDSDIGVRAILTSEQFMSSMIFQSEWKEFGHQQGFWAGFMCWGEDLHCFLDRVSQASVRFWKWKRNSKEADETKKK